VPVLARLVTLPGHHVRRGERHRGAVADVVVGAAQRRADQDWLRRRYLAEHASLQELAGEIGCSIRAVRHALSEAQVPLRPQGQWTGRRSSPRAPADTKPQDGLDP
jgi:hypothetical protein